MGVIHAIGGRWIAGFTTRQTGRMTYCMVRIVMDNHVGPLGKLRSGGSCIDFKASKTVSPDALRHVARDILADLANQQRRSGEVE